MDEVAKSASHATFPGVQSAAGFSEICDGTEFAVDGAGGVPPAVELVAGVLGGFFVLEARVDVSDQVCF